MIFNFVRFVIFNFVPVVIIVVSRQYFKSSSLFIAANLLLITVGVGVVGAEDKTNSGTFNVNRVDNGGVAVSKNIA